MWRHLIIKNGRSISILSRLWIPDFQKKHGYKVIDCRSVPCKGEEENEEED